MRVVRFALGLTFMCAIAGWLLVDGCLRDGDEREAWRS